MTNLAETGKTVARALLDAGCVTVRTDEPFRLPSGWASPVYMDCRRLISFAAIRREIVAHGIDLLELRGCLKGVASIVGGDSSGIALAAWMAEALDLPLQYVRKRGDRREPDRGGASAWDRVLLWKKPGPSRCESRRRQVVQSAVQHRDTHGSHALRTSR